jgi:serine/threonine protein kinase
VEGGSLAEVLVTKPEWWTPTVKTKAIAGIALGLRFAHSFGLIHGRLTASSILFDADHRIQIADFDLFRFEEREGENTAEVEFSGDILAFVSLLFEIVVGHPATLSSGAHSEGIVGPKALELVSSIIEASRYDSGRRSSFHHIVDILKQNSFEIVDGVDSVEVLAFVHWVELLEQADE